MQPVHLSQNMDRFCPSVTNPGRLANMGNGLGPAPLVGAAQEAIVHMYSSPLDDSFEAPSPIKRAMDEDWFSGIDQTARAMNAQLYETNAGVVKPQHEVAWWVGERWRRYSRSANPFMPISGNEAFPSARDNAAVKSESQGASSSISPRLSGNVRPAACMCTSDIYFHGEVILQPREQAIDFARAVCEAGSSLSSYVLWTGESFSGRKPTAGHSIVSQFDGEGWRLRVRRASREKEGNIVVCAHLKSIKWALEEAITHVELWPPTEHAASTVRIFTNNQKAICAIGRLPKCALRGSVTGARARLDMFETISMLSRRLGEMDVKVELHWVPRSRVPGYMLMMAAAKYASATPRGLREEEWTLPPESLTDDLDGETIVKMDEVDVEFKKEFKKEFEKVFEKEVKTKAKAKTKVDVDDDTTMASTVFKKEEWSEEEENKAIKKAWWSSINCFKVL